MTPAQERALIASIEAAGLAYLPYDPGNRRASKSYGWKYDFQTDRFVPCPELPQAFTEVARTAADFVALSPNDLAECLLNRYEFGSVIQPHCDKSVWEHVIGVSLGVGATMMFRHSETGEERSIELPPRSMYLLADDARYVWQHSLPPMEGTRYSITFRTFSAEGLRRLQECPALL